MPGCLFVDASEQKGIKARTLMASRTTCCKQRLVSYLRFPKSLLCFPISQSKDRWWPITGHPMLWAGEAEPARGKGQSRVEAYLGTAVVTTEYNNVMSSHLVIVEGASRS